MATRIDLPAGQWAEVKGPDDLTGADIDAYEEFLEKVREDALGPELPPEPDPENPAVMKAPERKGKWKVTHTHRSRDEILRIAITAWSYDLPLPYRREYRELMGPDDKPVLPARACRKLDEAGGPAGAMLNNAEEEIEPDPKPESGSAGTDGSSDTSPENTESLLPDIP